MQTWPRRRSAPPALLSALAALLAFGAASANDVEERIAHCADAGSSAERIACLERQLRELGGAPLAAGKAGARERAPATPPPAAAATKSPAGTDLPAPAAAPRGEEPAAAREPAPVVAAPEPAPPARATPDSGVELGAEQVAARSSRAGDEDTPRVRAQVVDFRFVGYERLMVQLDNGQVWRQIDGDRESVERGLRDADTFEVEMWATKLGGYRMRILPLGRTIRVERLR